MTADFGRRLRELRRAAGLSQAELTARIHYSKSQLSKVENGRARPNREFAAACDGALDTNGELVALALAAEPGPAAGIAGVPMVTPHFTGRNDELARISAALLDRATAGCVLSGMAGVGKTALAVRAASGVVDRFPDGCLFFDLRGYVPEVVSSADALDQLLRTLGVPGEEIPADRDGRANLYRDRLRGKRVLLVFDNVRSTAQVAPLLPAELGCRVLITSRNRLNALDDAAHVPVTELSTAEAVALFRSIAGDGTPAEDEPVAEVVAYCGRLPLAVRIAAARFRSSPVWTFDEFARRLADETARLDTLDDGERSVAAAFNLSYRALPQQQRWLFGLLALHPGRDVATRSAAALAGLGVAEAERLLDRLADAHLVTQRPGGYCQFHDLVRVFATEHALAVIPEAEQDAAATRLLDFALASTRACDELLAPERYRPPPVPGATEQAEEFTDWRAALAWIDVEWPNLVRLCVMAAVRGDHERCWRLAFLLREYFFRAKLWDPWIETHRVAAASASAAGDTVAHAMTLNNLGMAHVDRGDLGTARENFEQALELFREAGSERGTSTRSNLAWVNLFLGEHEKALRDMRIALEAYQRSGAARNAAITLRGIALAEVELGRYGDALSHAEQARDALPGSDPDEAMALNCIAWVHFRAGRPAEATAYYERVLELGERGRSPYEEARAKTGLGNIAAAHGRVAEAARLWEQAKRLHGGLSPVTVGEERIRVAS